MQRALLVVALLSASPLGILNVREADAYSAEAEEWRLTGKGEDYEIFQKPSANSSGLSAFRLVGVIIAKPIDVAIGILDRDHRMQWMRDVSELRTIRIPSPGTVVEYSAVKTPFVIKDRDFVIETSVYRDPKSGRITIRSHSILDRDTPPTGKIRGALKEGIFQIEEGPVLGTTRLTADMDVDPEGTVPRWIVNHFQKTWPVTMFRSLKNFLAAGIARLPGDLMPILSPAPVAAPAQAH